MPRQKWEAKMAKILFLCSFASPQFAFQTLKNCKFLFKVTKPFVLKLFFVTTFLYPSTSL